MRRRMDRVSKDAGMGKLAVCGRELKKRTQPECERPDLLSGAALGIDTLPHLACRSFRDANVPSRSAVFPGVPPHARDCHLKKRTQTLPTKAMGTNPAECRNRSEASDNEPMQPWQAQPMSEGLDRSIVDPSFAKFDFANRRSR
jgi:hypothetical protein